MRIGVIAPVGAPVPPPGYGGVEAVVSLLVEELVERGHDVTLFASGDSITKAELRFAYEEAPAGCLGGVEPDATHVGWAYGQVCASAASGRPFDVIHDHTDRLGVAFAAGVPAPVVHTVHHPFEDGRRELLGRRAGHSALTAVSDYQRRAAPELPWRARVHNAIDVDSFPFRAEKDDYLVCVGRVSERKGQDLAVEVARRAGLPLVIVGPVQPAERGFFEERVRPHVDGDAVTFLGEVSSDRKRELIAGARALLMPIRKPESFGLILVEAMACGTPVVARPLGAVPEVVVDGVTGFLASGVEAMAEAVGRTAEISPGRCREEALARFHSTVMAAGYEAVYRDVVGGP